MPRNNRIAPGGWVFHVLNRANARMRMFYKDRDYHAFEGILAETVQRYDMRLLAYCIMQNHWHMVLWPISDGDLGRFMQRLTITHVRRWHLHRQSVGTGHLYQGIYKSFPIQQDRHFLTVCRYVERNALRAGLVQRAEDWAWSSLAAWNKPDGQHVEADRPPLADWPVSRPRQWMRTVNQPQTGAELEQVREATKRGRPFGSEHWQHQAAKRLDLSSTMRPRGRPRKSRIATKSATN